MVWRDFESDSVQVRIAQIRHFRSFEKTKGKHTWARFGDDRKTGERMPVLPFSIACNCHTSTKKGHMPNVGEGHRCTYAKTYKVSYHIIKFLTVDDTEILKIKKSVKISKFKFRAKFKTRKRGKQIWISRQFRKKSKQISKFSPVSKFFLSWTGQLIKCVQNC